MAYRVSTAALNLRAQPSARDRRNILTVLHEGQVVDKLSEADAQWWHVRTEVSGRAVEGYVASRFLSSTEPEGASPVAQVPPPVVHMPVAKGQRQHEGARAYPLGEAGQPTRDGATADDRARQMLEIVAYLDVEHSARYRPEAGTTYCNIYCYDLCFLAGTYLPRVWWMEHAIGQLASGEHVDVRYGKTIRELNANSLYEWLVEWGAEYGWVREFSATGVQEAANQGSVALVCARRRDRNRSGHVAAVVPETPGLGASRDGDEVLKPVQSQAGATNRQLWVPRTAWWTDSKFDAYGWWHDQGTPTDA